MKHEFQPVLFRVASKVFDAVQRSRVSTAPPELPTYYWERAVSYRQRMLLAQERGWHFSAEEARTDFIGTITLLQRYVDECATKMRQLAEFDPELTVKLRDVYDDFVALQSDFDDFDWNISEKTLSIVVGPIELEDVLLGEFRVVLHWDQLGGSKPYEVLALDPNSPNDQSDVTHPHVHANQLCEGEGRAPIRRALEQGRFHDFFQLVTQILETYNESSAYVTLANWSGKVCPDCGDRTSDSDLSYCERCESDICGDCAMSCSQCHSSVCSECRGRCHGCESCTCNGCLTECADCSQLFCEECYRDGYCESCRKAQTEAEEAETAAAAVPASPTDDADAAVHADRVGQVAVLA